MALFLPLCGLTERPHGRDVRAHVRFLATSTSIRLEFAESEDVYLVELVLPHRNGGATLARLIDRYPEYRTSLPADILESSIGRTVRIRRDSACDISFQAMPLRTAPGDPLAVLPEKLGFAPPLPRSVAPKEILPCFRLVHR
jgi:hypothetical protein